MTTITTFDKQNLKEIRSDINAALDEVAKKYGLTFSLGNISFSSNDFSGKLSCATKNTKGDVEQSADEVKWRKAFRQNYFSLGLPLDSLDKKVILKDKEYFIIGARPRAQQNIVLKKADGSYVVIASSQIINKIVN